jgi:hypothetical protein
MKGIAAIRHCIRMKCSVMRSSELDRKYWKEKLKEVG